MMGITIVLLPPVQASDKTVAFPFALFSLYNWDIINANGSFGRGVFQFGVNGKEDGSATDRFK